jgi:hypothetical protein
MLAVEVLASAPGPTVRAVETHDFLTLAAQNRSQVVRFSQAFGYSFGFWNSRLPHTQQHFAPAV